MRLLRTRSMEPLGVASGQGRPVHLWHGRGIYLGLYSSRGCGAAHAEDHCLFKTVDAVQLGDPGPQLQKVIDFKKKVEEEKERLFSTFDDVEAFTKHLHVHLAAWMREHEKGLLKKPK